MSKLPTIAAHQTVDLSRYIENIFATEDHPLFVDAVEAAKVGALRAAYVMIWLSCAESLKRRFREAQKRDGAAGKIVGQVEAKERDQKSVDKFVLEKAKEYGFISDCGHTILNHIYEMRCLYGHPYEEAPSIEQVSHAAAVVVEHVLSKPVKLRHGFGKQLLKNLLENHSYLDNQQTAVATFSRDILPRIDECIYGWFFDNYFKELDKIADDVTMSLFFRRGIWFCLTMISEVGVDIFSEDDWHAKVSEFPNILMRVCSVSAVFTGIGIRAQDTLVGLILAKSETRSRMLIHLERLNNDGVLSERQRDRFVAYLSQMSSSSMRSSGLSTKTCYTKLIDFIKCRNWYVQNPAIDLIVSNGPDQILELDKDQQILLGRNILQAGEGSAGSANALLEKLSNGDGPWPFDFICGIAFETFTNESNKIRFKVSHLERVLSIISILKKRQQNRLVAQIVASVNDGIPRSYVDRRNFDEVITHLRAQTWAKPLVASLEAKAANLPVEEEEE